MPSLNHIPFRNIPNHSALFLDYLELSPRALRFFHCAPTIDSLRGDARRRIVDRQYQRKEIVSILRRQNESFGCDSAALHRISELENSDCVAILTGQQVGLFGGPLYTVYKALTAISLADELCRCGIRAVPIFWMDTEDHDLAEVTRHTIVASHSPARVIDYRQILFGQTETAPRSVGSVRFTESIDRVVVDFISRLPDSGWRREIQTQLELSYRPGVTFAQSFARLLCRVLTGSGLILFDPQDADAKRLTSGVYRRALCDADAIHAALVERKRELDTAGFHSQVNVLEDSTVLFYIADGERCALERRGDGFGLKGKDREFSLGELLDCADKIPEKLSPNVLLRPVVQDHLFPTAAYVGGPAEVAYFAQVETLYALLGRPMPAIWPRNSFTLLESEIGEAMDRIGINVEDCFQEKHLVIEKALRNSGHSNASVAIQELQERQEQVFAEIGPEVQALDSSLTHALETAKRKVLHNLQHLRLQAIRSEGRHATSLLETIDRAISSCYPNRNLQERVLGVHHFLARRGPSLLDTLRSTMEIGNFTHHVLRLE